MGDRLDPMTEDFLDELEQLHDAALDKVVAERDRLRAAVEEAVSELQRIHVEGPPHTRGKRNRCIECEGVWPCPDACIAVDLKAALGEDS